MNDAKKILEVNTNGYLHRVNIYVDEVTNTISLFKNYKGASEMQKYFKDDNKTKYGYTINGIPPKYMNNHFKNTPDRSVVFYKNDIRYHFVYFSDYSFSFDVSCVFKDICFIDGSAAHNIRLTARQELATLKQSFGGKKGYPKLRKTPKYVWAESPADDLPF